MSHNLGQLMDELHQSLKENQFIKLTLSEYHGPEPDLKSLHIRKVMIKNQGNLGFTYRYKTRDITKNFPLEEGVTRIKAYAGKHFHTLTLMTTAQDFILQKGKLKKTKPSQPQIPDPAHDRARQHLIAVSDKPFWSALEITDSKGNIRHKSQDKFRQINKYIEIMAGLLKEHPDKDGLKIVDMGCGKGYLTFALYDYLSAHGQNPASSG